MLDRFAGTDGARRLEDLFCRQSVVQGDRALASSLATGAHLDQYEPDSVLISQDGTDAEIMFLLSGSVSILVNGRIIAVRSAGTHVGEMALIDPAAKRSASVVARDHVVVARLTEPIFSRIATEHPELWRRIAVELADRLRQRSVFHRPPNEQPHLFVGCSTELLPLGEALVRALEDSRFTVSLWTDGVFEASATSIESLVAELAQSDFAALLLGADDVLVSRGEEQAVPRDNVIFELGLFTGGIGRSRTLLVRPHGGSLHLPTDLLGVTPISYRDNGDGPDATIATAADELLNIIVEHGAR